MKLVFMTVLATLAMFALGQIFGLVLAILAGPLEGKPKKS
jgi:hypothetical protein